ncbi:MAG: TolC family protein [Myxococcota bacterium]
MQIRTLSLVLTALLTALPGLAATDDDPPSEAKASPTLHGELALSLADAVAMGIENNLDVEISRYQPLLAEEDVQISEGAYDPELFSEFGYDSDETLNVNPLLGLGRVRTRTVGGAAGLQGQLPMLGGSYRLNYIGTSNDYSTTFFALSPEHRAALEASVVLPVMRNLFWSQPWTQVKLSAVDYDISLEEFRRRLMDTIGGTPLPQGGDIGGIVQAYWNLVAREEDLRVAQKSLETAEALLEQAQAQYDVGVVSRVEVVEAEAGVADRDFNLIGAQNQYRNAQDRLIDGVLGPNLTPDSRLEIRPTDRPERIHQLLGTLVVPDVEQAAQLAFESRPELAIARKAIEQNEITLQFAKNQRLPQLDLEATMGYGGLSGTCNPKQVPPLGVDCTTVTNPSLGGFSSANNFLNPGENSYSWGARGIFSIPLGNRQASGRASQADLSLRRSHTQLRRLEQDVVLQVRRAVRNLQSSAEGIEAAERRRLASEEQLRAETIRLEHGESTPFDVLLREEDLVSAESQKIFALQAYRDSLTALERAQGTILRNHNIVVEEALAMR